MKKLLTAFLLLFALSAQGQVKISDLPQVSPALGTDLVPMSNTGRSTSSSYVLSVATIGAYVLASPSVTGQMRVAQAAAGTPMIAGATDTTSGLGVVNNWAGGGAPAFSAVLSGVEQLNIRTNDLSVPSGSKLAWSSGALGFVADTNLSRSAAGTIAIGTGAAGSTAGAIVVNAITAGSTVTNNLKVGSGYVYFEDTNGFISRTSGSNVMHFAPSSGTSGLSVSLAETTINPAAVGGQLTFGQGGGALSGGTIRFADRGGNTGTGGDILVRGGHGSTTTTGSSGGKLTLKGGDANGTAANIGGDVIISGGAPSSTAATGGVSVAATGGVVSFSKTVTAGGTTGARTINNVTGTVNFAAAATSLVVTNNLANTSSIILATAGTNDATCSVKNVVAAAGSFTINMTAACTAETRVYFMVTN